MELSVLQKNIKFTTVFIDFLKSFQFLILILLVVSEFLFTDFINLLFFSDTSSDSARILKSLTQVIITIPFSIIIYVFIYWFFGVKYNLIKKQNSFTSFFKSNVTEWVLIQIRSFARIILYSFFLIIPGILESLRLAFSSLHVFYNKKMQDPYYDPIHDSRETLQPFTKTIALLFIFIFLIPVGLSLAFSERSFLSQPLLRFSHSLAVSFGIAIAQSFIFYKYIKFHTNNDLTFKG